MFFEIYQEGSAKGSEPQGDLTGGAWRWRLKCANDQTITSAESYVDHADCLRAVYLVRSTSCHTAIRDV